MAEYREVVKQQMRMCRYYSEKDGSCNGCPLYEEDLDAICDEVPCVFTEKDFERAEKLIIKWAEEHEPVYPT